LDRKDFELDEFGYLEDPAFCDWCLGAVVQGFIDEGDEETAAMMLACQLSWSCSEIDWGRKKVNVTIHGPLSVVKKLRLRVPNGKRESFWEPESIPNPLTANIHEAITLVLGPDVIVVEWNYQLLGADLPANWRTELLEAIRKKGTTNQGLDFGKRPTVEYANLRFRSQSEVRIARVLDNRKVLYFPNCSGRVSKGEDRVKREPDFLICHRGRWGILEVDGEPFHPPTRTVEDHDRDRLFQKHGVLIVQHYDANRCYQEPREVVEEFLAILDRSR